MFGVTTFLLGALVLFSCTEADDQPNPCDSTGMKPYDYSQALCMSFVFYEAQRSGPLPADQRIKWRHDSALKDGADNGVNLVGGYYDAGDHVKFGFPLGFTVTMLSWGLEDFHFGYEKAGQVDYVLKTIKWATDYMFKAHTGKDEYWGQVGNGHTDHSFWCRPEDMTMDRPSYKIDEQHAGTELAAETAAALAAASLVFRDSDNAYANKMLDMAKEMYEFADKFRENYDISIPDAHDWYRSWSGYGDELVWGALWLARATGDDTYLTRARKYYEEFNLADAHVTEFSWDDKKGGVYAIFYLLDGSQEYLDCLNKYLNWLKNEASYTPEGLVFLDEWGNARFAANAAYLALWAAEQGIDVESNRQWGSEQMNQLLGANSRYHMSFIVGFGDKYPERCHHRASSCPDPPETCDYGWAYSQQGPNPHTLWGALVGGPAEDGSYDDDRSNFKQNEVALDYNAAYSGALAALIQLN